MLDLFNCVALQHWKVIPVISNTIKKKGNPAEIVHWYEQRQSTVMCFRPWQSRQNGILCANTLKLSLGILFYHGRAELSAALLSLWEAVAAMRAPLSNSTLRRTLRDLRCSQTSSSRSFIVFVCSLIISFPSHIMNCTSTGSKARAEQKGQSLPSSSGSTGPGAT